jgi:hypothetical protein
MRANKKETMPDAIPSDDWHFAPVSLVFADAFARTPENNPVHHPGQPPSAEVAQAD